MSSNAFDPILDKAIEWTRVKLSGVPECEAALSEIRRRVRAVQAHPASRDRLVEPWEISQQLGIPQEVMEAIGIELHRLGILHHWVRISCPNCSDLPDNVILETDSLSALKRHLGEPCRLCGAIHDHPTWDEVDLVYAINLDHDSAETDFSSFFHRPQCQLLSW